MGAIAAQEAVAPGVPTESAVATAVVMALAGTGLPPPMEDERT